jgi:quinohemoprotein ethanol dehydrogenase
MGRQTYMACAACHGRNLVGAGGPAPDLRESAIALNSEAFWSVVHDGALLAEGMPRFAAFDKTQIEGLRQYIRFGARGALKTQ